MQPAEHAGGARIFLKREDLNHTGSHKINNVVGQALLARYMLHRSGLVKQQQFKSFHALYRRVE